jgi:hypothetical protein
MAPVLLGRLTLILFLHQILVVDPNDTVEDNIQVLPVLHEKAPG